MKKPQKENVPLLVASGPTFSAADDGWLLKHDEFLGGRVAAARRSAPRFAATFISPWKDPP